MTQGALERNKAACGAGVRCVVDAGLARRPCYDASTALTRLATVPISQASAEQRRGRAGGV